MSPQDRIDAGLLPGVFFLFCLLPSCDAHLTRPSDDAMPKAFFDASVDALHRGQFLAKHSIYSVQCIAILVMLVNTLGPSSHVTDFQFLTGRAKTLGAILLLNQVAHGAHSPPQRLRLDRHSPRMRRADRATPQSTPLRLGRRLGRAPAATRRRPPFTGRNQGSHRPRGP